MENIIAIVFFSVLGWLVYRYLRAAKIKKREALIDRYRFPDSINQKILEKYPHLNEQQLNQVILGLREYFHICNVAGRKMVAMPSQVVDVAWHEFILFTRKYDLFCKNAFGRFLHHTPAEAMETPTLAQTGIKRAWKIACQREDIKPKIPYKLPLIFALDVQLGINDGFTYTLNCKALGKDGYCASHIGCSSGGCGGSSDGGGSSGGCGGGCGGGD